MDLPVVPASNTSASMASSIALLASVAMPRHRAMSWQIPPSWGQAVAISIRENCWRSRRSAGLFAWSSDCSKRLARSPGRITTVLP